jgi:DNA-3-methyladenine glycosylase I
MPPPGNDDREMPEWARGDPLMEWYATEVWGRQVEDDDALFEVMSLQVFQAGLNWRMILARRDAFRNAFHHWRIDDVAAMGPGHIEDLLKDASIIRNRKKVEACVANARIIQAIRREHGSFCNWYYRVLEGDDLATLQKALRKTFKFMGPEIARMWLFASGRVAPDV